MIEGDIGAGNTTLWRATVVAAREIGYRGVRGPTRRSEESLAYAALGDLHEGVVDDPDLRLPSPQHRALSVTVLLAEPDDGPPDQRAVSMATLSALRRLSERSPVLVAVDDLHWMDGPSARVLEFLSGVIPDLQREAATKMEAVG